MANIRNPVPLATYRLQFRREFGFDDAAALAPYLARLGVSHLYASPYLQARPGSTHGYDIVDHHRLNPELGDVAAFERMVAALRANNLNQILDFVPNHMGVGGADNPWWLNVLEWGPDSSCAGWFDIDWDPDKRYLQGKLLLPFLGDQYGAVLAAGDIELRFEADEGRFSVWAYGTHRLPIRPSDYAAILGNRHPGLERIGDAFANLSAHHPHEGRRARELQAELAALVAADTEAVTTVADAVAGFTGQTGDLDSWMALDGLIQRQYWRLAHFRVAADDINYRRFFNINELAGLRMELPELFDHAHGLVFRLLREGVVEGLRIDHIDGLSDPGLYCRWLREKAPMPFYLVLEKILARHENLREDWPVEGTTGYEFTNLILGLLVDSGGELGLTGIYHSFTGQTEPFPAIVRDAKLRIMEHEMAGELNVLARDAARLARQNPRTTDFTRNILQRGLKEIIAAFPVYRTYVDGGEATAEDRRDLDWAVAHARRHAPELDSSVFDFLHRLLTGDLVARAGSGYSRSQAVRLAMRFQQVSGPVMAKGLEDTAFYRFNRMIALNEVGGHPDHIGVPLPAFHRANAERARRWPHTMLGTSTHDTKRGEDVRARLALLAEVPDEWGRQVETWSRILRARRGDLHGNAPPDRNDEYFFYQLLLGVWPAELTGIGIPIADALASLRERLEGALVKSLREAKRHSSWVAPDAAYEEAMLSFARDALDPSRPAFLDAFLPFQARIAEAGVINSLTQTLVKLTAPGVPDIYQGADLWDLTLVDPDNRRPVDYKTRARLLDDIEQGLQADPAGLMRRLLADWRDGAVKLAVTRQALHLRRRLPNLFRDGTYEGMQADGVAANHLVAFARQHEGETVILAATRLPLALAANGGWRDTSLTLPPGRWRCVLTGQPVTGGPVQAADLFTLLPVALLVRGEEGPWN
jgi:(1->4)-alpha-D-glucan 1-alpha-D-glucosylmutase